MSPVPKVPQYGDAARLQQLSSGLKREHGTYGAVVQRNEPGRPTGSTGTSAPRQGQGSFSVPPEHQAMGQAVAAAFDAVQFWQAFYEQYPGPNSQFYLEQAQNDLRQAQEAYYSATPNFET